MLLHSSTLQDESKLRLQAVLTAVAVPWQAQREVQTEKQGREDATAAVMKLQTVIEMVREEMEASQVAYARCGLHHYAHLRTDSGANRIMLIHAC